MSLTIYNVIGQVVRGFTGEVRPAGTGSVVWDGLTDDGEPLPSGMYFYRINAESLDGSGTAFVQTRRMMMVK